MSLCMIFYLLFLYYYLFSSDSLVCSSSNFSESFLFFENLEKLKENTWLGAIVRCIILKHVVCDEVGCGYNLLKWEGLEGTPMEYVVA